MKKISTLVIFLLIFFNAFAQNIKVNDSIKLDTVQNIRFNYKQLIIPAVLIGYGFWGMESGQIKSFNSQIRDEFTEDIDRKFLLMISQGTFRLFLFMR